MLEILPVKTKEEQKDFCEKVGINHDPDMMAYAAYDNKVFRGISLFRIVGKDCVIFKIKLLDGIDDYLARYLLAKAPLNFADLCGIETAVFADEDKKLAQELEFLEKDGVYTLSLKNYFTTPCSRHHEKTDG